MKRVGMFFAITCALFEPEVVLSARIRSNAAQDKLHGSAAHNLTQAGVGQAVGTEDDLIEEYYDEKMGIAWSMIDRDHWRSKKWGIMDHVPEYTSWAQSFVSIGTHKHGIDVYIHRAWGLAFHITPEHEFWKHFQVIGAGSGKGNIVGGSADGGSHTADLATHRLSLESQDKDYDWFEKQKNRILKKSKGSNRGWNEFITNALSKTSIAGILHAAFNDESGHERPTDEEMCAFLSYNVQWPTEGTRKWPIYAYSKEDEKTWRTKKTRGNLEIERYLECKCCSEDPGR